MTSRSTTLPWHGTLDSDQAKAKCRGGKGASVDRQSKKQGTRGLARHVRTASIGNYMAKLGIEDTDLGYYEVKTGTIGVRETLNAAYRDGQLGLYTDLLIENIKRYFRNETAAMKWLNERFFPLGIRVHFVKEEVIAPIQRGWQDKVFPELNRAASESRDQADKLNGFFGAKWNDVKLPVGSPPYGVVTAQTTLPNTLSDKGVTDETYLHTFVWDDTARAGLPDESGAEREVLPSEAWRLLFLYWKQGDHAETSITQRLRALGYPVTERWVASALRNKLAIGMARRNVAEAHMDEFGRKRRGYSRAEAKWEYIDLTEVDPPLEQRISVTDFDHVQQDLADLELANNHRKPRRRHLRQEYVSLFADVARCSRCGGGFSQMGMAKVEGFVVVRLRHQPVEGKGCFVYTVSERLPERDFYLWQLELAKPTCADEWIEAFVREFYKGSSDPTDRMKWLDDEESNIQFQLDEHLLDKKDASERLSKVRHERAGLAALPKIPTDFEINYLRDGRRIFGDPSVDRDLQRRFVTTVFEYLVFRAPEQKQRVGRRTRDERSAGVIDWNASKVREIYEPLVYAWRTRPAGTQTQHIDGRSMCVPGPSPKATSSYAHLETMPQGYERFAAVIERLAAEPAAVAA